MEHHALYTFAELGWAPAPGTSIAPGTGQRDKWEDLHIPSRMMDPLRTFNPEVPIQYLQQALAEILAPKSTDAITENDLMKYKYPPDQQPGAIKLVMEQMESMASRYAEPTGDGR